MFAVASRGRWRPAWTGQRSTPSGVCAGEHTSYPFAAGVLERGAQSGGSRRNTHPAAAAILEKPVSDRGALGGLTQFTFLLPSRASKLLILNGEMSEWSIEHAWKLL